jgi:hypothetical protein
VAGQRIGYVRVSIAPPKRETPARGVGSGPGFHGQGFPQVHNPTTAHRAAAVRPRRGHRRGSHYGRLARNLDDLPALIRGLTRESVRVEFVKEGPVSPGEDSAMAHLMLSVMGAFAESQRPHLSERPADTPLS